MLLYLTVMLKPLMPIISDAWSHEFNGMEHISLVHAKYGSNHLQKELADSSADSQNKKQSTLKAVDEIPFHIPQQICKYVFSIDKTDIRYQVCRPVGPPFFLISNLAPPPKFS